MLQVDLKYFIGKQYYKSDPNLTYVCVGVGQSPDTGANYVVGALVENSANPQSASPTQSSVRTDLLKDVTFIGDITQ